MAYKQRAGGWPGTVSSAPTQAAPGDPGLEELGATHMAVFDLFCGLVMSSGGFSLQIRWHQQLMLAWVVKPGYGGHRQGARNRFNSGSSS